MFVLFILTAAAALPADAALAAGGRGGNCCGRPWRRGVFAPLSLGGLTPVFLFLRFLVLRFLVLRFLVLRFLVLRFLVLHLEPVLVFLHFFCSYI